MRAAIYVRVSTGQQAMQDLSIPDQIAQCEAYCNKREWEVVATFTDAGVSASTDNRHDFQAMIAESCSPSKPIDVIIVHSQSRFARNTLDLLHYTKKLEKADVQFVSITQDIGNGDQADVLRTILGAMDEYQSKETSKHVKRSMCENARQGFWNGSQPPLGYRTYIAEKRGKKDKKKLEINPTEAEIVKRVFRL
ncbi:MAG: recombinase family protein, partial [Hyphomicrobiales bacterium]